MPSSPLPASLALIGAGKMGGAMLEGWLQAGLDPAQVTVVDPHLPSEAREALRTRGLALDDVPTSLPEVVVLAIKPQSLDAAAPGIAPFVGPGTLLISVLAGKTVADLASRLPQASAVVRAMPNLPASIGRGATGAYANPATSPAQRATADALLKTTGLVEWVDSEELIDAVTAVSGSGPAYIFLLAEALAHAGAVAGLPAELAARLARATVAGAGALLDRSDLEAATLRENVTSPGGTTAAALQVLMAEDGLESLMTAAVAAAKRRAAELSG